MIHVLDVPWSQRDELKEEYSLTYIKGGYALYSGALLPPALRDYLSEDYSYARWLEDERNGIVSPTEKGTQRLHPTELQEEAAKVIARAYEDNFRGFLLADKRGMGKSLSAVEGVLTLARARGFGQKNKAKVLIVTHRGQQNQWRTTLQNYPRQGPFLRPLIVSYQDLGKLLSAPPQARLSQKASTKKRLTATLGKPSIAWDYIIFDEFQLAGEYPHSKIAQEMIAVARLQEPYEKEHSPYVLFINENPLQHPLRLAPLAGLLGPALDSQGVMEHVPMQWGALLQKRGFHLRSTTRGTQWLGLGESEEAQRCAKQDRARLTRILHKHPAFLARTPSQNPGPLLVPLTLASAQKESYRKIWDTFRRWLNLHPARGTAEYREALQEYRKRVGYLKMEAILDLLEEAQYSGRPIYVQVPYPALAEEYVKRLNHKHISAHHLRSTESEESLQEHWKHFHTGQLEVLVSSRLPVDRLLKHKHRPAMGMPLVFITDPLGGETFADEISLLTRHRPTSIVYLPYMKYTLEENFLRSPLKHRTVRQGEQMLRVIAAKITPRHRLS